MILHYPGGSNVITRVLIRRRQKGQSQRRSCDQEAEVRECQGDLKTRGYWTEDAERGHRSRKAGTSRIWQRPGYGFSPEPPQVTQPC